MGYTSSECLILPLIEPTPYVRSYREICLLCSTHDPCYVHPRDMSVYMFKGSRFLSAVNAQKSEAARDSNKNYMRRTNDVALRFGLSRATSL